MASESLLSCIAPFLRHLGGPKESMTLNLAQRSFKVIDFGTNRKRVYILLLVVNSNLDPAPFQRYSGLNVENRQFSLPHLFRLKLGGVAFRGDP